MKQKLESNKGITLIALIITIIILLVLATVSIKLLIDNGIIVRAEGAKDKHIVADEKEKIALGYSDYKIAKVEDKSANIELQVKGADVDGNEMSGWYITFKKTGNEYKINGDGSVTNEETKKWDGESKEQPVITEDRNWHIYNAEQMKFFADFVNGNLTEEEKGDLEITPETTIYLEANLDLGARANEQGELIEGTEWTPIGLTLDNPIVGTFEGNNHYITGVYINQDSNYVGIFGVSGFSVKNLTVINSYVKGKDYCAGIIGTLYSGEIENCHNINTKVNGNIVIGGVCGITNTSLEIKKCTNSGDVKGEERIGGVLGWQGTSATAQNCINSGDVIGKKWIGGITGGSNSFGNIINCINSGKVEGERRVGGVAGELNKTSIVEKSSNNGEIKATVEVVGGIIGATFQASIDDCTNRGKVIGKDTAGGILGGIGQGKSSNITNCSNVKEIIADVHVGGIIGFVYLANTDGRIENNYNSGKVEGNGSVGGVIGTNTEYLIVKNNYNKGEVKGDTNTGALIGQQLNNTDNLQRLYYLNTLNMKAIGNLEAPATVEGVPDDLKTFEEFINWIKQK